MADRLRGPWGMVGAAAPFIANSAQSARRCKICARFWFRRDCGLHMRDARLRRSGARRPDLKIPR